MSEPNKTSSKKVGIIKVLNGKYMKDGVEKNRYNEIGVVFATPHHSRMAIKFHNTAQGEGQTGYIFYDEGCAPRDQATKAIDAVKRDGEEGF